MLNTKMNKNYLHRKIQELFIVHEHDGSYNLFGAYIINQQNNGAYKLQKLDSHSTLEFSSLKYAVTYCVFEKNNKYKEKARLVELDDLISSLEVTIQQHKKLAQKSEYKDIVLAKLIEAKLKKRQALNEMQRYTALSRYIQDRKFAETRSEN